MTVAFITARQRNRTGSAATRSRNCTQAAAARARSGLRASTTTVAASTARPNAFSAMRPRISRLTADESSVKVKARTIQDARHVANGRLANSATNATCSGTRIMQESSAVIAAATAADATAAAPAPPDSANSATLA